MKAIDILFNKIDELNCQIKLEKNYNNKIRCTREIKMIINALECIDRIHDDICAPDHNEYI